VAAIKARAGNAKSRHSKRELAWGHVMAKQILIGLGNGKAKLFATKSSFLRWAVSRDGWKHLKALLFWRSYLRVVHVIVAVQEFMRKKPARSKGL
jgi:hypothetical protein